MAIDSNPATSQQPPDGGGVNEAVLAAQKAATAAQEAAGVALKAAQALQRGETGEGKAEEDKEKERDGCFYLHHSNRIKQP